MHPPKLLPLYILIGAVFWILLTVALATSSKPFGIAAAVYGGLLLVAWFVATIRRSVKRHAANERLLTEGTPATARVLEARTAGRINLTPVVEISLEIDLPGEAPYRALARQLVSLPLLARVEPGREVRVMVDPHDPTLVVVDVEGSPTTAP